MSEEQQQASQPQTIPPFVRVNKGELDSRNVDIRDSVQPAADATAKSGIQLETTPVYSTEALDREKFMREEVEITLVEPGNENDPFFVEINVNGDYRILFRDGLTPQKVRRYHVAVLAQAKQSRVRQTKITNPDGSMGFKEESVLSLSYPFTVIADSRLGNQWLRETLRSPG